MMKNFAAIACAVLVCAGCSKSEGQPALEKEPLAKSEKKVPQPREVSLDKRIGDSLLIGLRMKDSSIQTVLSTPDGIRGLFDGVLVHRDNDWWIVDVDTTQNERMNLHLEEVLAWRVGEDKPKVPVFPRYEKNFSQLGPDHRELFFVKEDKTLLFTNGEHVSYETIGGSFEGGAHESAWQLLETKRIGRGTTPDSPRVPIRQLFGKDGERRLKERGKMKQGDPEKTCLSEPWAVDWGVIRSRGDWVVRAGLGHYTEICRGKYLYYYLGLIAPERLTGTPPFPYKWKEFSVKYDGLKDAMISGSGKLIVLVYDNRVEVEHNGELAGAFFAQKPAIVMTKWLEKGHFPIPSTMTSF
jgi:hypothetical protein